MGVVLTTLIAAAGLLSIWSIGRGIGAALPEILQLRRQVALGDDLCRTIVNLRDPFENLDSEDSLPRHRRHRHPAPKPITHRLHQFVKMRAA